MDDDSVAKLVLTFCLVFLIVIAVWDVRNKGIEKQRCLQQPNAYWNQRAGVCTFRTE
jgi:hypothetical protein